MNCFDAELPTVYQADELRQVFLAWLGNGMEAGEEKVALALATWEASARGKFKDLWGEMLAREVLLRSWSGIPCGLPKGSALSVVSPFGTGKPALGDLIRRRGAMAVFPLLRREHKTGTAAALFLVQRCHGDIWKDDLESLKGLLDGLQSELEGWHLFLASRDGSLDGDSLQLATHLALRAAREGNQEAIRALAERWATSGTVQGRRVGFVEVGNKLGSPDVGDRWLLLPEDTRGALLSRQAEKGAGQVRFAADVEQAWSRITTGAARHIGHGTAPTGVPVLHSLVSGAWQAVMASIILLRPMRVVLWASSHPISQQPADAIINALHDQRLGWLGLKGKVKKRPLSSESLATANREVAESLNTDLESGDVWFNVTNGNRVMSYAVLPYAQLHDRLRLIYRNLDGDPGLFTTIRYEGVTPETEQVACGKPDKLSERAWLDLFFKPSERQVSAEEVLKALTV
jgi:hypothetical protein